AGVVVTVAHGLGGALRVILVAGHQPERAVCERQADLALLGLLAGDRVDQRHLVAGQRTAHRAEAQFGPWRVADLRRGLRLAVPITDRPVPGSAYLLDYLRIQRLPRHHARTQC